MEILDKYTLKAYVEHGVILPVAERAYKEALTALEGKNIWLTLEPLFDNRTPKQNRYYWGVVVAEIIRWKTGYTSQEMHETLKDMFLAQEDLTMKPVNGRYFRHQRSTKKLSTMEFKNYIDQIHLWATEEGIYIPSPSDYNIWAIDENGDLIDL